MKKSNQFSELGMASVPARDSGLPGGIVIFVSNKGAYANDPLVKVSNVRGKMTDTGDTFAVSISSVPAVIAGAGAPRGFSSSELAAVYAWVVLNQRVLLEYWVSENYSTRDFLGDLRPL